MILVPFLLWRFFFLVLAVNYGMTVQTILAGEFDHTGLPAAMTTMEAVANGVEAFGWLLVFVLSWTGRRQGAARIAVFLAGLLFFDVVTTFILPMPLPPYFLAWGTVLVGVELLGARALYREVQHESVA
ncbi:hypothetical protein [Parvibaculum sp.]|uniref:hypothetical protein n=1 Tax=Parvibaculum sp. TaxID=2024848 RepID=UPI000C8F277D|nr:hypothetical protein [Parvibaculum sp.]MAB12324.1 hypothetical protein [Parvibaculum sp.]